MFPCKACVKTFSSKRALSQHLAATPACYSYVDAESSRLAAPIAFQPAGDVAQPPPPQPQFPPSPSPEPYDEQGPPPDIEIEGGPPAKLRRVTILEVEDEGDEHAWSQEAFPTPVATPLGEGITPFHDLQAEQESLKQRRHAPFKGEDEWKLVKWLLRRTTQEGADEFLKLPIVSDLQRLLCIT